MPEPISLLLAPGVEVRLDVESVLYDEKSQYQKIVVAETSFLGRVLLIDGILQFSSRDYRVYHEMIVHPAACRSRSLDRVAVIGGGDLFAAAELLKYDVSDVVVVDIDPTVTEVAKEFFARELGSLSDPRLRVVHEDGYSFIQNIDTEFDIVIVDSTDYQRYSLSEKLFSHNFYINCRDALTIGGVLAIQSGVPFLARKQYSRNQAAVDKVFKRCLSYEFCVPSFFGGSTVCTMVSKDGCLSDMKREPKGLLYADLEKISQLTAYRAEMAGMRNNVY